MKEAFPFATWLRNRRILGKRISERVGVLSGTVYPSKGKNIPDVKKSSMNIGTTNSEFLLLKIKTDFNTMMVYPYLLIW